MRRKGAEGLFNVLTIVLLGLTCLLVAFYAIVLVNPSAAFNPLPPRTPVPAAQLPPATTPASGTATLTLAAVTDTPRPTETATASPEPTASPTPVATLAVIAPASPLPTPTYTLSPFPFTVQGDAPIPIQNSFNLSGCKWMGIGGQVFDLNGRPITAYSVHLEGGSLNADSLTGSKPQYGPGGYEFKLADAPKQTSGVYRIQLRDAQLTPVSDWIAVNTFGDCARNVLLVNFVQNH